MNRMAALAVLILGNLAFAQAVGLVSPAENASLNSTDVGFVFNATDENSSVLDCTLLLDGANASTVAAANASDTSVSLSGVSEGAHTWSVSCTDGANSTGISETRIFVVSLPSVPSVELLSPADNASLNSSSVGFSFNATEANESLLCTLVLDGTANASVTALSGTAVSLTVDGIAEGAHSWSVSCTDPENGTGASGTRSFTVSLPPADGDHDGVPDSADMCPASVPDSMQLNPNQYGWLDSSVSFFEFGPARRQSTVYDMNATKGCTCVQIAAKLGVGKGQLKKGCSPGLMERWTRISSVPDRRAGAARQSSAKGKTK